MEPDFLPGLVIDRYRLERPLGEGGMGLLWVGTNVASNEHVALKFLKRASTRPEARQRFLREARATSAISHPHVIRVHEVLEPEGYPPCIVMELLVGESLRQRLARERTIALPDLARVLLQVVSAVGKAHELGIVHRDLTPANIFLPTEAGGVVKVLDFGIAKLTATDGEAARSGTTESGGGLLGTPRYMSPEQVFGRKNVDHRADLWSLGIILYEALAGVAPTTAENVGQTLKKIVEPIAPLRKVAPHVPLEVSTFVSRLLSRDPAGRPADLREVESFLARYAQPSFGPPAESLLEAANARDQDEVSSGGDVTADPVAPLESHDPLQEVASPRARVFRWPLAMSAVAGVSLVTVSIATWIASRPAIAPVTVLTSQPEPGQGDPAPPAMSRGAGTTSAAPAVAVSGARLEVDDKPVRADPGKGAPATVPSKGGRGTTPVGAGPSVEAPEIDIKYPRRAPR